MIRWQRGMIMSLRYELALLVLMVASIVWAIIERIEYGYANGIIVFLSVASMLFLPFVYQSAFCKLNKRT